MYAKLLTLQFGKLKAAIMPHFLGQVGRARSTGSFQTARANHGHALSAPFAGAILSSPGYTCRAHCVREKVKIENVQIWKTSICAFQLKLKTTTIDYI